MHAWRACSQIVVFVHVAGSCSTFYCCIRHVDNALWFHVTQSYNNTVER